MTTFLYACILIIAAIVITALTTMAATKYKSIKSAKIVLPQVGQRLRQKPIETLNPFNTGKETIIEVLGVKLNKYGDPWIQYKFIMADGYIFSDSNVYSESTSSVLSIYEPIEETSETHV